MNVLLEPDALIYPWTKAETRANIKKAFELIESKARAAGIDYKWSIRGGRPMVTTYNVRSTATGEFGRGSWDGTRIKLQSGLAPWGKAAPFKSIDALARIIAHETGHAMGLGHFGNGVMHPHASNWFSPQEIQFWKSRYGNLTKPAKTPPSKPKTKKSKKQQIKGLEKEKARLQAGVDKAVEEMEAKLQARIAPSLKAIATIDRRIRRLKK